MPLRNKIDLKIFILLFLLSFSKSFSYTNIQSSTSLGYYRDYYKTNRFPLYHSWTIKGLYEQGIETDIEFFANNDFSENTWQVIPTQAMISAPLYSEFTQPHHVLSKIKVGRQLFSEGFDLSLLDGLILSHYFSENSGVSPFMGYLRSTDFELQDDHNSPLLGLIAWSQLYQINLRAGYTSRDRDFKNKFLFAALQYEFENLWARPAIYHKTEFKADSMSFNQSYSDLALQLAEPLEGRLAYSNLEPRTTDNLLKQNFIYRLFSISPMETISANLTWTYSENLILMAGTEKGFYNSGFQDEQSERLDFSMNISIDDGKWLSPCVTHLKSYGGELTDFCFRYSHDLSEKARFISEFNAAYLKKVNQIEGWVEHLRGSYETHVWNRAKLQFAIEAERNQYFIFDMRAMAYVTNYL